MHERETEPKLVHFLSHSHTFWLTIYNAEIKVITICCKACVVEHRPYMSGDLVSYLSFVLLLHFRIIGRFPNQLFHQFQNLSNNIYSPRIHREIF